MYANGQLPQNRVDLNKLKVRRRRRRRGRARVLARAPASSCDCARGGRRRGARARQPRDRAAPRTHASPASPCHLPRALPQVQTLRKYSKQYEVAGVHPTSSKEDIAKAVSDHWNSVVRCSALQSRACCEAAGPRVWRLAPGSGFGALRLLSAPRGAAARRRLLRPTGAHAARPRRPGPCPTLAANH